MVQSIVANLQTNSVAVRDRCDKSVAATDDYTGTLGNYET